MNMDNSRIDILEEEILNLAPDVLERLLWDHSRPKYKDEQGEEHHHHIYWATDNYESEGEGFGFFDEIQISSITGEHRQLVRPRAVKSKEEQEKRTKDKAEVFTPSWVCNAQNNLVDDAWFGWTKDEHNGESVFNTEHPNHSWTPRKEPIPFPTKDGKKWQDYVLDTRLEITCGEAPYLVSRYDTTTGEPIDDLNTRIGLLDRKLRVVGENVKTSTDWFYWALCAVKSIYGYEWQGDNLLLAREAVFYTFVDYYKGFCEAVLHEQATISQETYQLVAEIVSWNIFQMDGLKFVLPLTCHEEEIHEVQQPTLFGDLDETPKPVKKKPCPGCAKKNPHLHNGLPVMIAEWAQDSDKPKEVLAFHTLLKTSKL